MQSRDERSTDGGGGGGVKRDCEKSRGVAIDRDVNCPATNARVSFPLALFADALFRRLREIF